MDSITLDVTPPPPGAGSPVLEAARAELREIVTNPNNSRYAGYHKGDPDVSKYLDGLYRRAVPPTASPRTLDQGLSVTTSDLERQSAQGEPGLTALSREERVASSEVQTMLRQTLGDEYDTEMRDMGVGAKHLFGGEGGKAALDVLASTISELGPLAEVRGIRYLAELGRDIMARQRGL